jgi:8-amino-7-oxononanoate synthase
MLKDIIKANEIVDFSSNDYLGLSVSQEVIEASSVAGEKYGVGATGSRILSGNFEIFKELEGKIAKDKNEESALIFNTGFQANISVIAALLDKKILGQSPLVFFDRLNHSSMYNGVFLSGAKLVRYRHNDMDHLQELLEDYNSDDSPKFIMSETVFGMDGDVVCMNSLVEISKKHNAFLYLDESHATGVMGKNGYGVTEGVDFCGVPHVIMGTFSKGLGCFGAYISCSENIKDYLVNKASGFIYSTALPPTAIAAASKAWDLVREFSVKRNTLMEESSKLRKELQNMGFNTMNSTTHIIPILIGGEIDAMKLKDSLEQRGIMTSAIRPPTVPPGESRIRIALTVNHTQKNISSLVGALSNIQEVV